MVRHGLRFTVAPGMRGRPVRGWRARVATPARFASAPSGNAGSTRRSIPVTRWRNAAASSHAWALGAGMARASRACASRSDLAGRAQQPVVADALEARRQHMLQEALR